MKKLSEQFQEMSQRAAEWEKQDAAIREENHKEYEAQVAEARKTAQSAQAAFAAKLDSMHDSMSSQWRQLQQSFNNQVAAVRTKAAEQKAAFDADDARDYADFQEDYANIAADFARMAADEANAASVEAAQARAQAESLKKQGPEKTTA